MGIYINRTQTYAYDYFVHFHANDNVHASWVRGLQLTFFYIKNVGENSGVQKSDRHKH